MMSLSLMASRTVDYLLLASKATLRAKQSKLDCLISACEATHGDLTASELKIERSESIGETELTHG